MEVILTVVVFVGLLTMMTYTTVQNPWLESCFNHLWRRIL